MTDELLSEEVLQKHERLTGARKPFLNQKKKRMIKIRPKRFCLSQLQLSKRKI